MSAPIARTTQPIGDAINAAFNALCAAVKTPAADAAISCDADKPEREAVSTPVRVAVKVVNPFLIPVITLYAPIAPTTPYIIGLSVSQLSIQKPKTSFTTPIVLPRPSNAADAASIKKPSVPVDIYNFSDSVFYAFKNRQ